MSLRCPMSPVLPPAPTTAEPAAPRGPACPQLSPCTSPVSGTLLGIKVEGGSRGPGVGWCWGWHGAWVG